MAKRKTITVNQLHKMLGKLIDKGEGRRQVCIDKTTFTHNCESDGCVILPVDGCRIEAVLKMNPDGGSMWDGMERYRRMAVLFGEDGIAYKGILDVESVEEYIRALPGATLSDGEVTLIHGNIRGFAQWLRERVW